MVGINEFRVEQEHIHDDHRDMMALLSDIDKALESLVCYSEVYADLKGVAKVVETGRSLAARLTEHFSHEEPEMLDAIAKMGPEFEAFSAEMKRQHGEFAARLSDLCDASRQIEAAADLEESISSLKRQVQSLAHAMTVHMAAEDSQFSKLN